MRTYKKSSRHLRMGRSDRARSGSDIQPAQNKTSTASPGLMYLSESSKIRHRVLPMLEGQTVVDLGCGPEKIVPWAVGVDDTSEPGLSGSFSCDIVSGIGPKDPLDQALGKRRFQVVYSSHALEHIPDPIHITIKQWARLLEPGGLMVLYLPDERFYVYDRANPALRNPNHEHLLTMPSFLRQVELVEGIRTLSCELDVGLIAGSEHLRYSFLWTGLSGIHRSSGRGASP